MAFLCFDHFVTCSDLRAACSMAGEGHCDLMAIVSSKTTLAVHLANECETTVF